MILAHAPVAPGDMWRAWSFDPLVTLGLLVVAVAYLRGRRRFRRRSATRGAAFAGGVLALAAALLTPLDRVAGTLFSAHMVQHLVLVVVAAPLLVAARPLAPMLVGLPSRARRAAARVRGAATATGLVGALRRPVVAWIALTIALWAWHTPSLYTSAVGHSVVHAAEHASFLLTSMLAWSIVLSVRGADPLGPLGRALFLVASAVQGGVLGAVLLFAGTPLYPVHGGGPSLWGLTPLEDQQLAGVLMWIPPSAVYLAAAAGVLIAAFHSMEAEVRADRTGTGVVT